MTRPRPAWTPPLREGVSASRVAVSGGPWPHVLAFLNSRMPHVGQWHERLQQGLVLNASGQALTGESQIQDGVVLWYWRQPAAEPRVPFDLEVLHQDPQLVVVDKPHFLPVTPGGRHLHETVLVRLKKRLGLPDLAPVHRLDRETAGVMLFTADPQARSAYHALLRRQGLQKVYEAVAPWRADLPSPYTHSSRLQAQTGRTFMQMLTLAGEPNAHTTIALQRRLGPGLLPSTPQPAQGPAAVPRARPSGPEAGELALYRLTPLTGRKHQLRVHLCELGIPIVGDRIYPVLWPEPKPGEPPDYSLPLQLLARAVVFDDPFTGQRREFTSRRTLSLAAEGGPDSATSSG